MAQGLKPRKDKWHHVRPTYKIGTSQPVPDFDITYGLKLPIPDQNQPDTYFGNPALPDGCTGFAASFVDSVRLRQYANPRFTYDQTLLIEGGKEGDECTLYDAFAAKTTWGVRLKGEDTLAPLHRSSPPIAIEPTGGADWFDILLQTVYATRLPVAVGTPWLPEWELIGQNGSGLGIMEGIPTAWIGGHAWCVIGQETVQGIPYLLGLTWNGPQWARGGLALFSREIINTTMNVPGSDALTSRAPVAGDLNATILIVETELRRLINHYAIH